MQNCQQGSVLVGAISYGKLSYLGNGEGRNPQKNPTSHQISYIVPPNKVVTFYALYFARVHFLNCLRKIIYLPRNLQLICSCYSIWIPVNINNFHYIYLTAWWGEGKRFFSNSHQIYFWTHRRGGVWVNIRDMFLNEIYLHLTFMWHLPNIFNKRGFA